MLLGTQSILQNIESIGKIIQCHPNDSKQVLPTGMNIKATRGRFGALTLILGLVFALLGGISLVLELLIALEYVDIKIFIFS